MVSQAQGFVHLLATAADNSHEPQVFRMRWDQPLKRFARAYAVFRELSPEAEAALRMSTRSHGEIDLSATAGVYGLTDGDQVVFASASVEDVRTAAAEPNSLASAAAAAAAAVCSSGDGYADGAGTRGAGAMEGLDEAEAEAAAMAAAEGGEAAAGEGDGGMDVAEEFSEAPPPAAGAPAGAEASLGDEARQASGAGGGGSSGSSGSSGRHAAAMEESSLVVAEPMKAKPKPKAKGKGKAKGKAKAIMKVKAKGKAKGKAKAKAKAKAGAADAGDEKKVCVCPCPRLGEPAVPRGNVRVQSIASGPAKGWRVLAWLQDVTGNAPRPHDRIVKWRIQSPSRSRTFSTFKKVEEEGLDAVHAQIYTAVRPQLLRRINDRRSVLEGTTPPSKRKSATMEEPPLVTPKRLGRPKAPKVLPPVPLCGAPFGKSASSSSFAAAPSDGLATQRFADPRELLASKAASTKAAWACGCDAHMRRHPRCAFGGHMQPTIVHLRDYMLVGRGESCDVVLNSRRTPQMISRCHAVLHREESGFALVDQGSLNGVLVNGEPVHGRFPLANGDVVTFGVPSPQPEFDYIFEERPLGLPGGGGVALGKVEDGGLMATQLHQEFGALAAGA
eukprot:CAMPEP_0177241856 /NCGR_PEP_ID=MMETSP0367-20130122/48499_1 /TAXON_ID=447022 ORGANISM="Scrippsiella hangoei-like, Strain SHHI-4" /NCGR_SAMPLE_ID=MMETSP0367 /ASSEMBLY_ACC=CAM_ASM_000362 /LENGTH=614 /DNA_ID=CAMNT_0018693437 /DNA_START=38 /DNA_END=1884 /DNA_ORIENTATION=-